MSIKLIMTVSTVQSILSIILVKILVRVVPKDINITYQRINVKLYAWKTKNIISKLINAKLIMILKYNQIKPWVSVL